MKSAGPAGAATASKLSLDLASGASGAALPAAAKASAQKAGGKIAADVSWSRHTGCCPRCWRRCGDSGASSALGAAVASRQGGGGLFAASRAAASKGSVNLAKSFVAPFTAGMAGGFKAGLSALVASPAAPVAIAALGIGYASSRKLSRLPKSQLRGRIRLLIRSMMPRLLLRLHGDGCGEG